MDGQIQGSKIGLTTNSETKMANAIRIPVPFSDPAWLLIDTPGFGDTEGPMDNIISAVSIAKVLRARLKTPPACQSPTAGVLTAACPFDTGHVHVLLPSSHYAHQPERHCEREDDRICRLE